MPISFLELAQTCAPSIAAETLAAVASVESGLAPLAIRVNSNYPLRSRPRTKAEAIETATVLIADGQNVDLGLGGINAAGIARMGLSVSDAFDPCQNLKATATLLEEYKAAAVRAGSTAAAANAVMLQSYYGQGDPGVGEMVGYDRRIRAEEKRLQPQLAKLKLTDLPKQSLPLREVEDGEAAASIPDEHSPSDEETRMQAAQQSAEAVTTPVWDVFKSQGTSSALVFSIQQQEQ